MKRKSMCLGFSLLCLFFNRFSIEKINFFLHIVLKRFSLRKVVFETGAIVNSNIPNRILTIRLKTLLMFKTIL